MQISISFTIPYKLSQNRNNNKINYVDSRHRSQQKTSTIQRNSMQEFLWCFFHFLFSRLILTELFFYSNLCTQKHIKTKIEKISIGPRVRTNMHS